MLKQIVTFLFLLFTIVLFAQDVTISSTVKVTSKVPKFRVLGKVGNNYVAERYGNSKRIFDIYDDGLRLKSSKEFEFDKNQTYNRTWINPQGGWMIYLQHEKEYSTIETQQINSRFTVAQKTTTIDTIFEGKDLVAANLRSTLSLNENLIAFYMPVFDNGSFDYFLVRIFNHKMKLVQQQQLKNASIGNSSFADFELFNDGSYTIVMQATEEKPKHSGELSYFIYYVDADGNVKEHIYQPKEAIFKKPKFEIDNLNKDLVIAGYYQYEKSPKKNIGADEFFTQRIDLITGDLFNHISTDFSNEFYFELTGKENIEADNVLYTFYINKIIPKTDGGSIVIAESFYKDEEQQYNNSLYNSPSYSNYVAVTVYNYNDIVVYDIDSMGNISNVQVAHKRQQSENDRGAYGSFFTMNEQDKIRLLFLEEIDDYADLQEYEFGADEVQKPSSLFSIASKGVFPIAKMSVQTTPSEILIPSFENNVLSLVKIQYD